MAKTIEQQIAEASAKLERLRQRGKAKDTRRKIIVGAIVITEALNDPASAKKLIRLIETKVNRDVDKIDVASLLDELRLVEAKGPNAPAAAE